VKCAKAVASASEPRAVFVSIPIHVAKGYAVANQSSFGEMNGRRQAPASIFSAARAAKAAIAATALALLAACGGGGVSAPTTVTGSLQVLPGTTDMYADTPVTFTISGGTRPYQVFSSNSSLLPLNLTVSTGQTFSATATAPSADTQVSITIRDSAGATANSTATVRANTLLNSLTVRPSTNAGNTCGGAQVCTGSDALASLTALRNGSIAAGRSIRFDVVSGGLLLVTPTGTATTSTVTTDSAGVAIATLRAPVGLPSQYSVVRATDVVSNQSVSYVLTVGQTVDSTAIQITPNNFQWTGAFNNSCAVGAISSHLVTGGTPPYTVRQSIPNFAILTGSPPGPASLPVPANGTTLGSNFGSILAAVTGSVCSAGANGNTVTVTDAIGRVATFSLGNTIGATAPPAPAAAVTLPQPALNPSTFTGLACGASTPAFVTQTIPAGYTGTAPVLSVVALEPLRIDAQLSNGVLTITRRSTDSGGSGTSIIRVSNGVNFIDIGVGLDGAAPFSCTTTTTTTTPIASPTTGSAVTVSAAGTVVTSTFTGGTGPFTVTSQAPGIVLVSPTGVAGTFTTAITIAAGSPRIYFLQRAAGATAGLASFVLITDSSSPVQSQVQTVNVGP
jgi:hypothetical protein